MMLSVLHSLAALTLIALGAAHSLPVVKSPGNEPCRPGRLTVYNVIMNTFWSKELFPKQYPEWRPNAQFSKVLGRSHDKSYVLWRLGTKASDGVKLLAEESKTDKLDAESQGQGGILDEFLAPPVTVGVGKTETLFFVDGNHSKVSLMSHIVPSPDWFVGLDSFDLCVQGKWLDAVTLEVDPMDAGTDDGFTFTAPNWASEPTENIYRITAKFPDHPANSFHYPHLKKLPTLATFTFIKVKEYELSEVFKHNGAKVLTQRFEYDEESTNAVQQSPPAVPAASAFSATTTTTRRPIYSPRLSSKTEYEPGVTAGVGSSAKNSPHQAVINNIRSTYTNKGRGAQKTLREKRGPRHCHVGAWSEWSACSRSCGIGEMKRTRVILKHARRGGRPCPGLVETKWCGSARCAARAKAYFDW